MLLPQPTSLNQCLSSSGFDKRISYSLRHNDLSMKWLALLFANSRAFGQKRRKNKTIIEKSVPPLIRVEPMVQREHTPFWCLSSVEMHFSSDISQIWYMSRQLPFLLESFCHHYKKSDIFHCRLEACSPSRHVPLMFPSTDSGMSTPNN